MASLLSSIPPSTDCSAARSCGGCRPKSSLGGEASMPGWPRSSTTAMDSHLLRQASEHIFDSWHSERKSRHRHPTPSARIASRRDDARRCWRLLQGAAVYDAVHRVCISVDTSVEGGVENLWINPGRNGITADKGRTTRAISCGQESLRRVGPGYCVGRVGFQPDFRRVTGR